MKKLGKALISFVGICIGAFVVYLAAGVVELEVKKLLAKDSRHE